MCGSNNYYMSILPPRGRSWKFLGGGGSDPKTKFSEERYEAKLEFPQGARV